MLVGILKFLLGFSLAIAILIGGGIATALYLMNRVSVPPAKPIYANDKPIVKAQAPKPKDQKSKQTAKASSGAFIQESTSASSSSTEKTQEELKTEQSPKPEESTKPLPSGAYQARVTWQQGLTLRKEPTPDAERVGGVGFNQRVVILEESSDQAWQKIRLEDGTQEGWVKAGNIEKVDE
ncbi:SH3 domain-containing protein [Chlorogloeopsis sp. ULAP01]|uniref:SH3 domain-containing protein n=1 Tax=Chlorogloeopsis sp. ULAP01 TaxID=3056483 RepID=UPI0025AB0072|nr:SH3 domain-containing protein [Chlorogloeopsis sp. ULAP01]MDM9385585.1 SH3 domain-containing protein [Chlorogloeopsis sp. ULAP01]